MRPTARRTTEYLGVPILVLLMMSFKQLSVSHLKEYGFDGKAYQIKYALAGPHWEIYRDWIDNPDELRIDVFYTLARKRAAYADQSHSATRP